MAKKKGTWTMVGSKMTFVPTAPAKKAPAKKAPAKKAPAKKAPAKKMDFSDIHRRAREQGAKREKVTAADVMRTPKKQAPVKAPTQQSAKVPVKSSSYIPKGGGGAGAVFKSLIDRSSKARARNKERRNG